MMARQGVAYPTLAGVRVADPATMADVPADGATIGEVMLRSNTVMKGYLKNPAATAEAFAGGWFHTGDLGVMHEDGYVEIKDRSKDIIISGGENISSLEVEEVLYKHPAVMEAAVVARPDAHWGESPCAFVTLKPGAAVDGGGHHRLLPRQSRPFQGAADGGVRPAAQDLDRQDPEIRAARPGARARGARPMADVRSCRADRAGDGRLERARAAFRRRCSRGAGAAVVLLARRAERLAGAAAEIAAAGGRAAAVACDVTDYASVRRAVDAAEARHGPIDILVNNAGIAISKPLLEHTEADWDDVLDTNLKGAWLMSREMAALWIAARRGGRIINIASLLALRTIRHVPAYAAAKAGLVHLTHTLALELGRYGITVNAIAPGYFETDLNRAFLHSEAGRALVERIPLGRSGEPPDLDGALLLLCADAGAYITGAVLPVDGGHAVSAV